MDYDTIDNDVKKGMGSMSGNVSSDRGGARRKGGLGKVVGVLGLIIGVFGLGALTSPAKADDQSGAQPPTVRQPDSKPETIEEASPKDGTTKTMTLPGGVKMEMVYVAPGTFKMGSYGEDNEKPVHDVRITKGYWIGKYPVTQSQWKALVSANGVSFAKGEPVPHFSTSGEGRDSVAGLDTSDFPMENISWDDCDKLVKALNRKDGGGRTWSMPTEAQWEFAARGGNKSHGYTYSGGSDMDALGWYYENSGVGRLSDSDWKYDNLAFNKCRTHSVKEKDVGNELGIVGMSGNVSEWCQDWYNEDYYSKSQIDDPCNTASGDFRVLRGGCWSNLARSCRSASRIRNLSWSHGSIYGFRLCCSEGEEPVVKEAAPVAPTASSSSPKAGATKTLILPGGATMEMIYVEPGSFMMGSPTSEDGRYDWETQHRETLTKGFWLGKYEVTQKQWQSVMGGNPSHFKGDNLPVESVSWNDCQEFMKKVNAQLNCGARLPTEAEWECACRAGTTGGGKGSDPSI